LALRTKQEIYGIRREKLHNSGHLLELAGTTISTYRILDIRKDKFIPVKILVSMAVTMKNAVFLDKKSSSYLTGNITSPLQTPAG
jgi:hypothetical protein